MDNLFILPQSNDVREFPFLRQISIVGEDLHLGSHILAEVQSGRVQWMRLTLQSFHATETASPSLDRYLALLS